ncbi:hypothetical protein OHO28_51450 [Streptomyces europaeiscabiei]|uniref:hypothetical protein n=1 Tax=Streptomyces europaeiscabiei TaxID=146819 RepID=UPI002E196517
MIRIVLRAAVVAALGAPSPDRTRVGSRRSLFRTGRYRLSSLQVGFGGEPRVRRAVGGGIEGLVGSDP